MRERARFREFAHRAGPALPSYLALHHAGFSRLPVLLPGRWALTPPFHPCLTNQLCRSRAFARLHAKTSRRFPCAMPPCCSAGGIFSVALSVTEPHRVELSSTPPELRVTPPCGRACVAVPWRYQARCPTSSPALASLRRRCPDFPPAPIARSQRSPGPSATSSISRISIARISVVL